MIEVGNRCLQSTFTANPIEEYPSSRSSQSSEGEFAADECMVPETLEMVLELIESEFEGMEINPKLVIALAQFVFEWQRLEKSDGKRLESTVAADPIDGYPTQQSK